MAVVGDWTRDVAQAIVENYHDMEPNQSSVDELAKMIQEKCPFKANTGYMDVGVVRRVLESLQLGPQCWCAMAIGHPSVREHSAACQQAKQLLEGFAIEVPPPLLQCIQCHNTESPAGAMARAFNHGRCLHCGNYFKVVRP